MFKLFPEENRTFLFNDYGLLMEQSEGVKSVLEFGPGSSTLAFIEAGVERIVSCEDDDEWFEKAKEKFKDYPQVTICRYKNDPVVTADDPANGQFDLAFVDAPKGTHIWLSQRAQCPPRVRHPGQEDCSRLNTTLFALDHAKVVLLHDACRPLERATLGRLNAMGYDIEIFPTDYQMARIENDKDID